MYKMLLMIGLVSGLLFSCNQTQQATESSRSNAKAYAQEVVYQVNGDTLKKVIKSPEEWKEELSDIEFEVLRNKGTERAHTGDLLHEKRKGTYVCRGCQLPLFSSDTKYKSGTGWPSFWKPIKDGNVASLADNKYGWNRVEVLCARCDGHLGHVFEDGPEPTGLRYCINAVSLDFLEGN